MKKTFLLFCMTIATLATNATTYVLYGTVPAGATDLTASVTAEAVGSATFAEGVFTGAGLPGRYCESNNYLKLSTTGLNMTLTSKLAVHVVLQRSATATGNVQVAFCNGGWNATRAGWQADGTTITETEATDVVLNLGERDQKNYNSYNEGNLYGDDRAFSGEILRLCAAAGEAFAISSIYVVSEEEVAPDPENIGSGYAIYGAVPADYVDCTEHVTIAGAGSVTWEAPTFTGAAEPSIIANTGDYLNVQITDAKMFLENTFALHISIKKAAETTGGVQVSLTSGNWNACRVGWLIANSDLSSEDYTDIALLYSASDETMQWSSQDKQNLLGSETFNGTILRICAAAGQQFDINRIYIEKVYGSNPGTAVENVNANENANANVNVNKVIRNGQVYILRGGKLYNVAGSLVK